MAMAMADRLEHRGPDDKGVWTDPDSGFAVAHRRLSIIDLSSAGHQPMLSANGRWVLAYNGEIYNHLELRQTLETQGNAPQWRGHSDTETLLAAIQAWGVVEALRRSLGMFALALWDRTERAVWLARDRVGEKPLYYGTQGNVLMFASELKALRPHPAFRAEIDRNALALLLRYNYIPAPYSIYAGIGKLRPGTCVRIGPDHQSQTIFYWSLAEIAQRGIANPFRGSEDEALDVLEQRLSHAIREQMIADVPLGALLSGGIDSSTIAALMQANGQRPIRTFTIGFDERTYDESRYAHAVAAHLGTEHTDLRLGATDALALIPQLTEIYDEPFADSSQLPTHLVMQLARRYVKVALSGDGGDEFFGGYNRYILGPKAWRKIRWMPQPMRAFLGRGLARMAGSTTHGFGAFIAGKMNIARPGEKIYKIGLRLRDARSEDDFYMSLVSEWFDVGKLVTGSGDSQADLLSDRGQWPQLSDPVAKMMVLDGLTYLPDDILAKVDRAAMSVSLETRAPFLDQQVMEFAWSLPVSMKLRQGKGKWLLRRLLDRYVPVGLIERPKMGFAIPLDHWLRGELRDWAESLLAEDRLRREGYLDPIPIRNAWLKHREGQGSYGYRLWSALMFQAWLERQQRATPC
jgi:asparagine synthase (glutamine-hydrolysing)